MHHVFNTAFCEATREGRPTPVTKHIELIQRVAVALHVLENTLFAIIKNNDITFTHSVSIETVKEATKYVQHWEGQKEAIIKVSK